jgi:hypothetical protein
MRFEPRTGRRTMLAPGLPDSGWDNHLRMAARQGW